MLETNSGGCACCTVRGGFERKGESPWGSMKESGMLENIAQELLVDRQG